MSNKEERVQALVDGVKYMIAEIEKSLAVLEDMRVTLSEPTVAKFATMVATVEENLDTIPYGFVKQIKPQWDAIVARYLALAPKSNA